MKLVPVPLRSAALADSVRSFWLSGLPQSPLSIVKVNKGLGRPAKLHQYHGVSNRLRPLGWLDARNGQNVPLAPNFRAWYVARDFKLRFSFIL